MMIITELFVSCSLLTLCVSAATSFSRSTFNNRPTTSRPTDSMCRVSTTASTSSLFHTVPIFGIRGGGLFGNNSNKSATTEEKYVLLAKSSIDATATTCSPIHIRTVFPSLSLKYHAFLLLFLLIGHRSRSDVATTSDAPVVKYPAMSQQEIEEWLEHIPVFAVTDPNGAGVILKPENDTSVFYFFVNPLQANATLQQLLSSNSEMNLKVSAFSLGKIWFNILNANNTAEKEVLLKSPNANETDDVGEMVKGVEYRLVPDSRDLLGARMLLTLSPEDGEKLKNGGNGSMTPEMVQTAITKAMTESPKFKTTFNEIPVFTIAQMRMQKQSSASEEEDAASAEQPVTLLPMYFSLQNMVGTWQQFMSQAPVDIQGVEPAINLMSLHDIVQMMQQESEIDWRHVVLVPPTNTDSSSSSSSTGTATGSTNTVTQMGGATLGDDEDDADDE